MNQQKPFTVAELAMMRKAWPEKDGHPICAFCGHQRKNSEPLCQVCWADLSPSQRNKFAKLSLVERAFWICRREHGSGFRV